MVAAWRVKGQGRQSQHRRLAAPVSTAKGAQGVVEPDLEFLNTPQPRVAPDPETGQTRTHMIDSRPPGLQEPPLSVVETRTGQLQCLQLCRAAPSFTGRSTACGAIPLSSCRTRICVCHRVGICPASRHAEPPALRVHRRREGAFTVYKALVGLVLLPAIVSFYLTVALARRLVLATSPPGPHRGSPRRLRDWPAPGDSIAVDPREKRGRRV